MSRPLIASEALRHQVAIRLEELMARPTENLAALPEWHTELVAFGETNAELITYSILREDGSRWIVVQAVPEGTGLVWWNVRADGFKILGDGERTQLTERDLYEFQT